MSSNAIRNDVIINENLDVIQQNWGWLLALGILMIVLGVVAIAVPLMAALAIELLLGWLLVIGGIGQGIHAFSSREGKGFWLELLLAALYLGIGIMLLAYPVGGIVTLTLLLAAFFIAEGIFKIVMGLQLRPAPNWGWILTSGILALLLGALIMLEWPSAALWAIGLLVGVDLIFGGWSLIMLSLTLRRFRR